MVVGHVEHAADVASVESQPFTQDAAPSRLQHRHVDHRIGQHHSRADRAAGVAFDDPFAADIDARGAGEADGQAPARQDLRHHPHRRGLAVGPGDRHDRNARRPALWEQHVQHRLGHVPRLSLGRLQVHAESRRGVDLHDAAAGVGDRPGDVGGEEVDAGDVEADHRGRPPRDHLVHRMDDIGPVDGGAAGGEVGGVAQPDHAAGFGNAVECQPLGRHALAERLVDHHPGHHRFMAGAAARIGVELIDQGGDALAPVAHHLGRDPLGHRNDGAVDHQDPIVAALELLLDDDAPPVKTGLLEPPGHLLGSGQADVDAASMVAVERLGHHRATDLRRLGHGLLGRAHHHTARGRHAGGGQQGLGQVLVARGLHRDQRGVAGDGRAQDLLPAPPPQTKQALLVEPADRDVAPLRLGDEGGGRGPQGVLAHQRLQRSHLTVQVKGGSGAFDAFQALQLGRQQAVDQAQRGIAGGEPDRLVAVAEQHVVDAGSPLHRAGLAAGHRRAGERLQFQRQVLDHVPDPGPFLETAHQAARGLVAASVLAQPRQQGDEPLGESGQAVGRPRLQATEIQLQPDHRHGAEQVRPAIHRLLQEPQGRLGGHVLHRGGRGSAFNI